MVRLTRRTRRKLSEPERITMLDERTRTVWREFKAEITGRKGEGLVVDRLSALGLPAMHDVILALDGVPTQIDHLVRCPGGIAVLETKAWSGEIEGTVDDQEWLQSLDGGRYRGAVINPLRQNQRHTAAVAAILAGHGLSRLPLTGHVVMTGSATLTTAIAPLVLQLDALGRLLDSPALPAAQQATLTMAWTLLRAEAGRREALRPLHQHIMASRAS